MGWLVCYVIPSGTYLHQQGVRTCSSYARLRLEQQQVLVSREYMHLLIVRTHIYTPTYCLTLIGRWYDMWFGGAVHGTWQLA